MSWTHMVSARRVGLRSQSLAKKFNNEITDERGCCGNDVSKTKCFWNTLMQSRGRQPNLSFFAFTATPKGKTLELFGRAGASGVPEAFHIYSMRQAIEEKFILDVLTNYTTYKLYYHLLKVAEDDPKVPRKKGTRVLAKFTSLHPYNIEQ